jgi:hypothetical protein
MTKRGRIMNESSVDPHRQFAKLYAVNGGQCLVTVRALNENTPGDEFWLQLARQASMQQGHPAPTLADLMQLQIRTIRADGGSFETNSTGLVDNILTTFGAVTPEFGRRLVEFAEKVTGATELACTVEDWMQQILDETRATKRPTTRQTGHA